MTPEELDLIPTRLLHSDGKGCRNLIAWLGDRGLCMTLLELEQERAHRGIPSGGR